MAISTITGASTGSTGTVITTGSSGQVIPKAALPTGSVLQVVNSSYSTATSTSSTSYVSTGHTGSITPTSSTSKILIIVSGGAAWNNNIVNKNANFTIYRNAANLASDALSNLYCNAYFTSSIAMSYLDSPATTSSTTYTVYFKTESGGTINYVFQPGGTSATIPASMTLMEISA